VIHGFGSLSLSSSCCGCDPCLQKLEGSELTTGQYEPSLTLFINLGDGHSANSSSNLRKSQRRSRNHIPLSAAQGAQKSSKIRAKATKSLFNAKLLFSANLRTQWVSPIPPKPGPDNQRQTTSKPTSSKNKTQATAAAVYRKSKRIEEKKPDDRSSSGRRSSASRF